MKYFLLVLALMLSACSESDPNAPQRQPVIKKTFDVDGCEVKYVEHPYLPNFYIARCGNTVTETWQRRAGKATYTEATVNVNSEEELRNRLTELETRKKALNKLSDEEKKVLGVK
jgi:hypothetical protein